MRLADALMVMVSRLVIRVENMVTTSSLEVLGVDLNGTTSNYLQLPLLVLTYFLPFPSSQYFNQYDKNDYVENCYTCMQANLMSLCETANSRHISPPRTN